MAAGKVLYIDPWTGVAGDMLLAALLDTEKDGQRLEDVLRQSVASLGLDPDIVTVTRADEAGVSALGLKVNEEGQPDFHHLHHILEVLEKSDLAPRVKERSTAAFRRLAEAEAEVHGTTPDRIHFHEVGSVDTMVDVVGAFSLIEALGVERVVVGTIPVGGGTVMIAHGRMNVPAPATALLLAGYPTVGGPEMRELTTPTGALLVGQLGATAGCMPAMAIESVGYGRGTMKLESGPNILRVFLGSEAETVCERPVGPQHDTVVELECNLDDISAEVIGWAFRKLRKAGALEVWSVAAQMKKDRPATVLHVLARPEDEAKLVAILFSETGTLGVRRQTKQRWVADRGMVAVTIDGVEVAVKWGRHKGRLTSVAAECDSASAAAMELKKPLKDIMSRASEAARRMLEENDLVP